MIELALSAALLATQPGVQGSTEITPADAALMLQGVLAQGMNTTYHGSDSVEGRYISFGHNSLTVMRRGYQTPSSEWPGGWYAQHLHIHRFDLAPVEVSYDPGTYQLVLTLTCEAGTYDCIGVTGASAQQQTFIEDRGLEAVSIAFDMHHFEDDYADEMDRLFEVWRSAPEEPELAAYD